MMMKKTYSTPQVDIVMLAQQQPLLIGSYDGPANAPEVNFIDDDSDIFSADGRCDVLGRRYCRLQPVTIMSEPPICIKKGVQTKKLQKNLQGSKNSCTFAPAIKEITPRLKLKTSFWKDG